MNTTWTPPPVMPADLPPLPMGKNGKPLVYVPAWAAKGWPAYCLQWFSGEWTKWLFFENCAGNSDHYAAESDSEICRANQWGDFTPKETKQEPEPCQPKSAVERHLDELRKAMADAEKDYKDADAEAVKACELRTEKLVRMNGIREIIERLEHGESPALARRAWYLAGRKDERHHAKVRTVFPLNP